MSDTARDLIAATQRCIADHGLAGATSRTITADAGANLAAITYHFGSKNELITQALLAELRSWFQPTLDILSGDDDIGSRGMAAVQQLVVTFHDNRDRAQVYLQALLHTSESAPLRSGVVALWAELRGHLAQDMTTMKQEGLLSEWVEPEVMATLFLAIGSGLVLQVTVDPDSPPIEAMAAQFVGFLLSARPPR